MVDTNLKDNPVLSLEVFRSWWKAKARLILIISGIMSINLHLKTLTCTSLWASHHTRVVDQDVNLWISIFGNSLWRVLVSGYQSGSEWQFQDISGYQCEDVNLWISTLEKLLEIWVQHSFTLLRLLRSSLFIDISIFWFFAAAHLKTVTSPLVAARISWAAFSPLSRLRQRSKTWAPLLGFQQWSTHFSLSLSPA